MRVDRAVTMSLGRVVATLTGSRPRVPVLMYHGIRDCHGCSHPYYETHTTPDIFEAQMRHLRRQGYRAVSPGEALAALRSNRDFGKAVVITFDDGYADFETNAAPVLASYGFSATLFVVSGFLDSPGLAPRSESYLSWSRIRNLREAGIEIGSHTATHCRLQQQSGERRRRELAESKARIEDELGCAVDAFAYPYSFPDQDADFKRGMSGLLEECGYRSAVTTMVGRADAGSGRYFLPRLPINLFDDDALFAAKLSGAYDWMRVAQRIRKRVAAPREAQVRTEAGPELSR